jgi:hypothetical protein
MKATVQIERIKPTTSVGEGVKVTYIYTDYDKSVIDRIEEELRSKINGTRAESEDSEKINCKTTKCENCTNHNYCDYEP